MFLKLDSIEKFYGRNHVVRNFSFAIERGELVSFLGPSGCGKTTLLRMIAGFETPTCGAIMVEGKDITHKAPNQRSIGMVFQAYALFPNMSVFDNVAFGLRLARKSKAEIKSRVEELLCMIELPHLAARYPSELSGGQQQRVALARALARNPDILLLDEPLSALDAKIRHALRDEIKMLQQKLKITTVFVTHDQEEALSISDRVLIMHGGVLEQAGTPREIYARPRTRFVTSFLGAFNVFEADVVKAEDAVVALDGQKFQLEKQALQALTEHPHTGKRTLAIRPEAFSLVPENESGIVRARGKCLVRGHLADQHFFGAIVRLRVRLGSGEGATILSVDVFNSAEVPDLKPGDAVSLGFDARDVSVLAEA